jgi:hypothetical protein
VIVPSASVDTPDLVPPTSVPAVQEPEVTIPPTTTPTVVTPKPSKKPATLDKFRPSN